MNADINEVEINGIKYIRKDALDDSKEGYSIVRCATAGVFMGIVEAYDPKTATAVLKNARRIWYWDGAASLSQLAVDGTSKPLNCKFPVAVAVINVGGVCEIIPCTQKSVNSINSVPIWKM